MNAYHKSCECVAQRAVFNWSAYKKQFGKQKHVLQEDDDLRTRNDCDKSANLFCACFFLGGHIIFDTSSINRIARVQKVKRLVSAFFADPRVPKAQRIMW